MKATIGVGGATLHKEDGDKRISHESTVGYRLKLLLNSQEFRFVRYNPSKENMTSCKLGLIDRKAGIVLWHERYAIEDAAQEFNKAGKVFLMRTDFEVKA